MTSAHEAMTGKPVDRAATPDPVAASSLIDEIASLQLEGAFLLRGAFSEPWCYSSGGGTRLGHGRHVIAFHVVVEGTCWAALETDGERHWAERGDVIVMPYATPHFLGGLEPAEPVGLLQLAKPPPWSTMPVLRCGGQGDAADLICAYVVSDDLLFDPTFRAFPPLFVVRPPPGPTVQWVEASIAYATEASMRGGMTPPNPWLGFTVATRIPELLLSEVLRLHLAAAPTAEHGWGAALRDPVLGRAMAALHHAPERKWTVADLAAEVAVSRSVLDERFRRVLGRSPMRYLTEWRMHLADELLANTDLGIVAIARQIGYESEEAFSRAFKRSRGAPPSRRRLRPVAG